MAISPVGQHCQMAKRMVDHKYASNDCATYSDFRKVLARPDVDAVLIGTPDHWHVPIAIEAMKHGKDVYSEKPETLTINQGKELREVVRQTGRVYSGGSQRVWHPRHRAARGQGRHRPHDHHDRPSVRRSRGRRTRGDRSLVDRDAG